MIMKQARKMGISAIFLGGDSWSGLPANYHSDEIFGSYFSDHWHPDLAHPPSRSFVERYTTRQGTIENSGVPLGYDAVMVLADAIHRSGSTAPESIRDALAETNGFQCVTGDITMNPNGDPVKQAVVVRIDENGISFVKTIRPE